MALAGVNEIYGLEVKTQVLYDVDLAFDKGSFASIVGASGSGKSTLLHIMGTLDTPTSGEVIIDGRRIGTLGRRSLATSRNLSLGFIFQFHYLLPEFTARENVLMPYRISGRPSRAHSSTAPPSYWPMSLPAILIPILPRAYIGFLAT